MHKFDDAQKKMKRYISVTYITKFQACRSISFEVIPQKKCIRDKITLAVREMVSLGQPVIGVQLSATLKPLNTIVF